jgi:hypothetical protein
VGSNPTPGTASRHPRSSTAIVDDITDPHEIDAVVLAGRERRAVLIGKAKWARSLDARTVLRDLERKSHALPDLAPDLRMSVCARERVSQITSDLLVVTAADIF